MTDVQFQSLYSLVLCGLSVLAFAVGFVGGQS